MRKEDYAQLAQALVGFAAGFVVVRTIMNLKK